MCANKIKNYETNNCCEIQLGTNAPKREMQLTSTDVCSLFTVVQIPPPPPPPHPPTHKK